MLLQSVLEVLSSEVASPQLFQDGEVQQLMEAQLQTSCNGLPSKHLQMPTVPFACNIMLTSLLTARFAPLHKQEKEFAKVIFLILN